MNGSVDHYLETLSEPRHGAMQAIVTTIRTAAPTAVESMMWGMPCWEARGRVLSAKSQKAYISLYMCTDTALAAELRIAEPRSKGGKACVNYADSVPVPLDALAKIVARELG